MTTGRPAKASAARRPDGATAVFFLLVTGSIVTRLWLTQSTWFYLDDWPLILQSSDSGELLEPYNGHLSLVLLAVYRFQAEVFGFKTYVPLRLLGALAMATVPVTMFFAARPLRGATRAALTALPLVWFNRMTLEPAALNLYLSIAGGIVCIMLLNRASSRRNDFALAASLSFSLACAGSGVAVAVACIAHITCSRTTARRSLAVVAPLTAWVIWWLVYVGKATPPNESSRLEGLGLLRAVGSNVIGSFEQLALGFRVVGVALMAAYVVLGMSLLRGGLDRAANMAAGTAGLISWWFGLAFNRGSVASAALEFRYAYIAAAFILVATVPHIAPARHWKGLDLLDRSRVAVVVVLLAGVALASAVQGDLRTSSRWLRNHARSAQATVALADRGPSVVPDPVQSPLTMYLVTARQVRVMTAMYGKPYPTGHSADRLLATYWIRGRTVISHGRECSEGEVVYIAVPQASQVRVGASSQPARVEVRRFGSEWVPIGTVAEGNAVTFTAPDGGSHWRMRVLRGCPYRPGG